MVPGPFMRAAITALALVPLASAVPLVALHAELSETPPLLLHGALAPSPTSVPADALFAWAPGASPPGVVLVEADRAVVTLLRWSDGLFDGTGPAGGALDALGGLGEAPLHRVHTNLTLRLAATRALPQAAAEQAPQSSEEPAWRLSAAACRLARADAEPTSVFPQDTHAVPAPDRPVFGPWPDRLEARCTAGGATASRFQAAWVYDVDLELSSDQEARSLRTGTFAEEGAGALAAARRVTQVLRVDDDGVPLHLGLAFPLEARLHASAFAGGGRLEVGAAAGNRTWGGRHDAGALDPFVAEGAFAFDAAVRGTVRIEGQTLVGPPERPPAAAALFGLLPAGPAWLVAAGLAGAVLLVVLFSRLVSDRLLDHPRRRCILDRVAQDPGVEANEIARALGLAPARLAHHVRVLERGGRIVVRRFHGRTALFAPGAVAWADHERRALLRRGAYRRALEAVSARPGLDQAALSGALGVDQPRASRLLGRLVRAGAVRVDADGPRRRYRAATGAGPCPGFTQ